MTIYDKINSLLKAKNIKLSLKLKLIIPLITLLCIIFIVFIVIIITIQAQKYEEQLTEKVEHIGILLVESNIDNVWNNNIESLKNQCTSVFKDKEITRIRISSNTGEVLVNIAREVKDAHDIIKEYSFIKNNENIGHLQVVFTDYYSNKKIRNICLNNILFTLFILLTIIAIVYILLHYTFQPLRSLMEGVNQIMQGNYQYRISVATNDELDDLANAFNTIGKEVRMHEEHLEELIGKHTVESTTAMEKLRGINEHLNETQSALWGEMELAKKIQTVLLPKKPILNGYEIATYVMLANDVGGDYYDVINVNGKDWVAIGDVSGHGVPAGLIMMMVQTAIHTVLVQSPEQKPSTLLKYVNAVITENINRLGGDKYVTITVMAFMENGKIVFSGLHQDIVIYRAATKDIEIVETVGMWLGFDQEIMSCLKDDSVILEKDDVLLLFTDGLTEAIQYTDSLGLMRYGNDQLYNQFKLLGDRKTDEIMDGIIDSLKDYAFDDDVTIVIIKKIV